LARENVSTVYELIQMLAEFPADMEVAAAVIAEGISPLNSYADGSVDIDEWCKNPEIFIGTNEHKGKQYVRLEVTLA
jgi:hypothetical protein